jgi:hypothetical protein
MAAITGDRKNTPPGTIRLTFGPTTGPVPGSVEEQKKQFYEMKSKGLLPNLASVPEVSKEQQKKNEEAFAKARDSLAMGEHGPNYTNWEVSGGHNKKGPKAQDNGILAGISSLFNVSPSAPAPVPGAVTTYNYPPPQILGARASYAPPSYKGSTSRLAVITRQIQLSNPALYGLPGVRKGQQGHVPEGYKKAREQAMIVIRRETAKDPQQVLKRSDLVKLAEQLRAQNPALYGVKGAKEGQPGYVKAGLKKAMVETRKIAKAGGYVLPKRKVGTEGAKTSDGLGRGEGGLDKKLKTLHRKVWRIMGVDEKIMKKWEEEEGKVVD